MRIDYLTENFEGEDFLVADGFDDAIIGVDENSMRIIYSVTKSIEILMKENMTYEEANEYFYFNVSGSYVGDKTPIWCYDNCLMNDN